MTSKHTSQNPWDRRYQTSTAPGQPCEVLRQNLHLLPDSGTSLDLACGLGANALCLAEQGLDSHGWDNSSVGLQKLAAFAAQKNLSITTLQRDVEQQPPAPLSFDVIVVSQFLYRTIFPDLIHALKPNGLLFYQTFHQHKVSASGPSRTEYLLTRNELLQQLGELTVVYYREDSRIGKLQQGLRDCSYFVGQKPA